MSGTYELDGQLFPQNPIEKIWTRTQIGVSGIGSPIFGPFWTMEARFDRLNADGENSFFMAHYLNGGLHTVKLPHPYDGSLTQFTGVALADVSFAFDDIDRDSYAVGSRVVFGHINILATGTP